MHLRKKLKFKKVKNGYAALAVEGGEIYYLNDTGYFILNCLIEGDDVNKIVSKLSEKFKIKKELAKNDVNEFIKELRKLGVIA